MQKFINNQKYALPLILDDVKEVPTNGYMYKFWSALVTTQVQQGDFLILPEDVYFNGDIKNGSIIYIRESYKELYDLMFNPNLPGQSSFDVDKRTYNRYKNFIITGTPGVGKSNFAFYVVYRQLQEGKTILWQHRRSAKDIYLLDKEFIYFGNINTLSENIQNESLVYLVDAVVPLEGNARTVLFVSPDREIYKNLEKENGLRLYMPVWSWEEILLCHDRVNQYKKIDINKIWELYLTCGGVPRLLFIEKDTAIDKVDQAIARSDLQMIKHSLGAEYEKKEASHLVIHFYVSDDPIFLREQVYAGFPEEKKNIFDDYPVIKYYRVMRRFASNYVAERVLNRLMMQKSEDLKTFLAMSASTDKATLGALRGHMFEAFVHKRLCQGGILNFKSLRDDKEYPIEIKKKSTAYFYRIEDIPQLKDNYGIPINKNMAAIDSVIINPYVILFQITVAESHSVHQQQLVNILELVPKNVAVYLCFVVPKDVECKWTQPQKYTTTHGTIAKNTSQEIRDRVVQLLLSLDLTAEMTVPPTCK